jgi:hypothetical protein
MKSSRIGFCLLFILTAQIFAQRFTAAAPETFTVNGLPNLDYLTNIRQTAVLGERNSSFSNLMLCVGRDNAYHVVNSHGIVIGNVIPMTATDEFHNSKGEIVHDYIVGGAIVLDSLNDDKKNAVVLFSSLKKIIIMQIILTAANTVSYNILKNIDLPETMWQGDGFFLNNPGYSKRLALCGITQNNGSKLYHIAMGNPFSKSGSYILSGRIDFFSLTENTWIFAQPNSKPLTSGSDGLYFGENSEFGMELAFIGDLDKNGYNELAVLLPASAQYPNSAIYIFFMDNEWTPSSKPPVVITGNSIPWLENPEQKQDCRGLTSVNWQKENVNLLVACNIEYISGTDIFKRIFIKNLVLNSDGNILNSSIFFNKVITTDDNAYQRVMTSPLLLKNHKNDLYSIVLGIQSYITAGVMPYSEILSVMDVDFSKNFLLEAGKPEIIVDLDSLFYRSGTSGFSAKTLFGLVQCGIQNNALLCEGEENAIGSWSSLELSSRSECDVYRECKRKDTIFVYVRARSESPTTALRISKNIVLPFFGQINLGNIKAFAHFKNPDLQNVGINQNTNGLKLSAAVSNDSNELLIIPFSQREGIDTLVFNLSISATTNNYPIYFHIADTSKILERAIPANPGEDTVWNTGKKRYIALPHSNSSGNIYTYDIMQDSLGTYAEILGEYLHILKIDVAEISVAYTENGQIKYRKITLMPEPEALPPIEIPDPNPIVASTFNQNLNATHVNGGLQISGLSDGFELRAYNLKGMEIQRLRANAKGSVFVKLKQHCPQIVRIKSGNEQIYLKVAM